jgi:RNA polymerase sigma-54 factor
LNSLDLYDYVNNELMENPVLEEDDSRREMEEQMVALEISDRIAEDDYDDRRDRLWESDSEDNKSSLENFTTIEETLQEHLMDQLNLTVMPEEQAEICRFLVESIDDNGYLTTSAEEVCAFFACTEEEFEDALQEIWQMDPCGVGARNLAECLEIQLCAMGRLDDCLSAIIWEMLPEVAENKVGKIAKRVRITNEAAQAYIDLIRSLEPKPGRQFAFGRGETQYVVPDINVEKEGDDYVVSSNDASIPRLRVSSYYRALSGKAKDDPELADYLSGRLNSAMWLIRSIEQRKQTIFNVASAIVNYQRDFFERGERYIKTLTLKQLADEVGVHESTVSRAINGKYMQTPQGVFEMKYFFTSGVSVRGEQEGLSSNSVKVLIREIIGKEDPRKPWSDQAIVKLLKEQEIDISRRTVAKYREEMGIPSSSGRRRY